MSRPLCTCRHALAQHELAAVVDGHWSAHVDGQTGELLSESGPCKACACRGYTTVRPKKKTKHEKAIDAIRADVAGRQFNTEGPQNTATIESVSFTKDGKPKDAEKHGPKYPPGTLDPLQRAALAQPDHAARMRASGWKPAPLDLPPPPKGWRYVGGVLEKIGAPQAGLFDAAPGCFDDLIGPSK